MGAAMTVRMVWGSKTSMPDGLCSVVAGGEHLVLGHGDRPGRWRNVEGGGAAVSPGLDAVPALEALASA
jgi:hypothetical protein